MGEPPRIGVFFCRQDLPLALLSFNVGVELGQLGFVALVLAMTRSFRVLEVRWPRWVEVTLSMGTPKMREAVRAWTSSSFWKVWMRFGSSVMWAKTLSSIWE